MAKSVRILVLVTVVVGGAVGLAGLTTGFAPRHLAAPSTADESDESTELDALFGELARAWNPRVKSRIVERARGDVERWGPLLLEILKEPENERLQAAISLSGDLRLEGAHALLVELAESAPERCRATAVTAAARLAPWPIEALRGFLRSQDPDLRAAAVPLAVTGPAPLVRELVMMFEDADEAVRQAVALALPPRMPAPARRELRAMAAETKGEEQLAAVEAMGRILLDSDDEVLLCTLVGGADHRVRLAALDALAGLPRRLRDTKTVWELASSLRADPVEQARAFSLLERTGSYSAEEVEDLLPQVEHVLPRFFAARCLVHSGEKSGALALLEMLADDADWPETLAGLPVDAEPLRAGARAILAAVCGTAADAGVEVWRQWLQGEEELAPRYLEPTVLTLPENASAR